MASVGLLLSRYHCVFKKNLAERLQNPGVKHPLKTWPRARSLELEPAMGRGCALQQTEPRPRYVHATGWQRHLALGCQQHLSHFLAPTGSTAQAVTQRRWCLWSPTLRGLSKTASVSGTRKLSAARRAWAITLAHPSLSRGSRARESLSQGSPRSYSSAVRTPLQH